MTCACELAETKMTEITPETAQAQPDPNSPAGSAKQMLGDAGRAVREEAAQFASSAQDKARGAIDQRKDAATRTLGDFADAVRKAGDELGQRDQSMASQMVRQAADSLEGLSRTLSERRPEELLDTIRDFGRRNPAAFLGGALLIGVAVGRFARASSEADGQGRRGAYDQDLGQRLSEPTMAPPAYATQGQDLDVGSRGTEAFGASPQMDDDIEGFGESENLGETDDLGRTSRPEV